jgi:hypothetical protein
MFPQTIQDWVEQANVNDQGSNINARRHFEGWSLGLCLNFVKDDSIDREVEKQFVGEAPDNLNNWRVIENNDAEMKFAKTERYSKGIYAFKIDLPSTTSPMESLDANPCDQEAIHLEDRFKVASRLPS